MYSTSHRWSPLLLPVTTFPKRPISFFCTIFPHTPASSIFFFWSAEDGATEWPLKGQVLAGVVASHSACLSLSGWLLPSHTLRQHLSAVTELPGLTNPHLVPLAAPEHGVWVPVTSYGSVLSWSPGLKVGTHPAMATSIPLVGPKVIIPYRYVWMCAQHEVGTLI